MTDYPTHTLANGLRIVLHPSASQVVYCGIAVGAGTRHELPGEEGLAHFCEHLAFKGTRRRTAVQIINTLEGVGGELNAFTGKEDTVYYAVTTRQHLRQAVSVLTDIVFESQYPPQEVEKEREVVCDELESYEDTPAELIFDEIENILFEGHPLGHNILGTSSQVRGYGQADARRFVSRHYKPANSVFFASGNIEMATLVKMLEASLQHLGFLPEKPGKTDRADCPDDSERLMLPARPGLITRQRGTHQAHVIMATPTFPASDPRRWTLFLLNNLLGGPGLNSRLNIALRERRGLVYTVESSMTTYSDTGLWTVYFGCDPHDVARCQRLVQSELSRMAERPLTESQLRKARLQLRGQLCIGAENREQQALDMGRSFLHEGRVRTVDEVLALVDQLTPAQLQQLASELFAPDRLTTLIYD